jgi:hypothetical protein
MSKNRVIYQSQAVYAGHDMDSTNDPHDYVSESGSSNRPTQLQRIQNANYNFEITRQDVNQFGNLAAITRTILDQPTVGLDMSWYLCNFHNEAAMGFLVNGTNEAYDASTFDTAIGSFLDRTKDERNYYIRVVKEGSDAAGFTTNLAGGSSPEEPGDSNDQNNEVIGIGNGFLSSYSLEAAVGGFPTANATVEGLNIAFYSGITGFSPHVNAANGAKNTSKVFELGSGVTNPGGLAGVLKPGDIEFSLPDLSIGPDTTDVKVQSFNVSLDLGREPLQKLGSRYAYAREIAFPVTVTCAVDALVGDLDVGNLSDIIDDDENSTAEHTLIFKMNKPDSGGNAVNHIAVVLKKAKLDSMDFSNTIGDNKSVSMNFSLQVGSKEQDDVGMFLSGKTTS